MVAFWKNMKNKKILLFALDFLSELIIFKVRKSYSTKEVTMAMITAMSTRGQIVLPKKVRTALKLDAGTQFIVFSDNDNILLKPIKEPKLSDFEQLLSKAQQFASDNGMQETDIDEAIKSVRKKS